MPATKTLYHPAEVEEIKSRISNLKPDSPRQWGRMAPAQAVAHCALSLEWAVGDRIPPQALVGRIIGGIIKPMVIGNDQPFRKNVGTTKDLMVEDQRDLTTERDRLYKLIDRFASAGPAGCTSNPHAFFGHLKPEEWAVLMYKHLDHHLRQFGV